MLCVACRWWRRRGLTAQEAAARRPLQCNLSATTSTTPSPACPAPACPAGAITGWRGCGTRCAAAACCAASTAESEWRSSLIPMAWSRGLRGASMPLPACLLACSLFCVSVGWSSRRLSAPASLPASSSPPAPTATLCAGALAAPPCRKGATLGCFKRTCRASYHLACARKYNCLLQVGRQLWAALCAQINLHRAELRCADYPPAGVLQRGEARSLAYC